MESITSLERLDAKIAECDAADSDAALREIFATFRMEPPLVGVDPFSGEYLSGQMALYKTIAEKNYQITNEETKFDIDAAARRPFPYGTNSAEVVGTQLLAIGSLLRRLDVPAGARILEFGPGWGNTTLAMAMAGYEVTAVDIEPRFCELIRRRAAQNNVSIQVVNSDFMWAENVKEPYDAVVFFECFHHCADHMRLLKALRTAVKPKGRVYFGAEPITDEFPAPWGLRLDGESLWAIRKHGWLELGFTEKYFEQAMYAAGWDVVKYASGDHFSANVWEAKHLEDSEVVFPATSASIGSVIGSRTKQGIMVEGNSIGWAFFGPYLRLPAGTWIARAIFASNSATGGVGTVDVCGGSAATVIASEVVDLSRLSGNAIQITFEVKKATNNIQMRFFCTEGVTFILETIEFRRG